MLNLAQMIADTVKKINDFKKENLDSLQKTYDVKMGKIAEFERQLAEIPEKYKGKSQTFINKKKKQMNQKIEDLTEKVNDWYEQKKKEMLDKVEDMLNKQKEAAQKAKEDEDKDKQASSDLAANM